MTPTRRRALEWVRDNGNKLNLPDRWEPSQRMLLTLDNEGLIKFSAHQELRTWDISETGISALSE